MAFSREHKEVIVEQYREWIDKSKAIYYLTYNKMTMPAINDARAKLRESESHMHVVKNRLFTLVLEEKGYKFDPKTWEGNNAVIFAFEDAPAAAKAVTEITKGSEVFATAGGYLDKALLDARQVKALADLPTLPVMRSMLMGTILAPASQLVRTLAEPARGLAAVIKANSEKQASAA
ncbi:MAG: 50S ribosomal protein L10 [Chloroflexi bacterium]|nr:50S ribosomal protein L10 [Chloroflexota bacterium]